jgi:dihydroceramidase
MHVATGTVMHQVFTFEEPSARQRLVRIILLSVLIPFYIYHCMADEFAVHGILFLTMISLVIWKTRLMIRERITDPTDKSRLSSLATIGMICAALGYGLWNIDVHFCPTLIKWKQKVGMPWAIVLELHGWWHILTAVAAYTFMAIIEFLTCAEHGPEARSLRGKGFAWPATAILGELAGAARDVKVKISGNASSSQSNGRITANGANGSVTSRTKGE